jgi:recombination protein RecA
MEINKNDKLARPENVDRQKAVSMALMSIEKQFGKGSIMKLGEGRKLAMDLGVISTGILGLDLATGVGGVPRGRITEIYGPESSGKTTIALYAIAQAQREGGVCAFIDAEHALDVVYAKKLGVNTDDLLISQPDTGEQALEIAEILVRSGGVDVIVIDSVAALVPRAELEGDMGDSHMGLQARLMSQALRKLTGCISKSKTSLIFINQLRMKLGVMFGNPETTTGGNALKFYASLRMDIRRISAIKNGDDIMGSRTRVKVVKNKMAPPFREVEFDILFGEGISREGDIIDLGCQYGIIEKSGSWFAYEGEKLGQGRDNTRQFLKEHPEFVDKIRKQVEAKAVKDGGLVLSSQAPSEDGRGEPVEKSESKDKFAGKTPTAGGVRANPKKGD